MVTAPFFHSGFFLALQGAAVLNHMRIAQDLMQYKMVAPGRRDCLVMLLYPCEITAMPEGA